MRCQEKVICLTVTLPFSQDVGSITFMITYTEYGYRDSL